MEELKRRRGVVKASLTRIQNYVRGLNADNIDAVQLQVRNERLEKIWIEYNDVQFQIEIAIDNADELEQEEIQRQEFEERFYFTKGLFRNLLHTTNQASTNHSSTPNNAAESDHVGAAIQNLAENQVTLSSILDRISSIHATQASFANTTNNAYNSGNKTSET